MKEKKCAECGKIFNNSRKNGKGKILGKQWENVKYCSIKCNIKSRNKNEYVTNGDVTYVYTNKREKILIDTEDIEKLKNHFWSVADTGYACTYSNKKNLSGKYLMHHYILGKPKNGLVTDHKNGNKIDNRKSNLRFVEQYINAINKKQKVRSNTKILGISYTERLQKGKYLYKKYRAEIIVNGKVKSKLFNNIEEAIKWRSFLERKFYIDTGYRLVE